MIRFSVWAAYLHLVPQERVLIRDRALVSFFLFLDNVASNYFNILFIKERINDRNCNGNKYTVNAQLT